MSLNKNNISLTTVLVKLIKEELNNSFINENKLYPTNIINNLTKKLGDSSNETINKLAIFGLFRQAPPFNTIKDINQLQSLEQLNVLFNKWKELALTHLISTDGPLKGNKTASISYLDAYINNIVSLGNEAKPFSYRDTEKTLIDVANNKGWIKSNDKSTQTSNIESPDKQDILFEDNTVLIVKAPSKAKCIMYGQGKTWCISQTGLNMYNTYRIKNGASIYFVLNKTKSKEDKERVCVILRYSGDKYGIADATNSGQRSGGPEVAGQGFSYVESELPWLTGKGQYFPESKVTKSEKDYAKFTDQKYIGDDLGDYIINIAKNMRFNKEEVDPVDLLRDYVINNGVTLSQFKSLPEPMKVQYIEMGYGLGGEMVELLNDTLKVRYAVIALKKDNYINLNWFTNEQRDRIFNNVKDVLSGGIIKKFISFAPLEQRYDLVQKIFPLIKNKLDAGIVGELLIHTPEDQKNNLLNQVLPLIKDNLDTNMFFNLLLGIPYKQRNKFVEDISPLVNFNVDNIFIISKLLTYTPEEQRNILANRIFTSNKDSLNGNMIGRLLENTPEENRYDLVQVILSIVKDSLDYILVGSLISYTPEEEKNNLIQQIFPLVKNKLDSNMVVNLLGYTSKEKRYDLILKIFPLVKDVLDIRMINILLRNTPEENKQEIESLIDKYKQPVNENIVINETIDEATYPENFDLNKFKKLKSFKERVDYCNSTLTKLGAGSSRIVYLVDDKTVLKLAKNQKGIAQNKVEIGASDKYYSNVTAEVYESDDNSLWLEMELAKPINKTRFKEILGYSVEDFGKWVTNFWNVNNRKKPYYILDKQVEEIINESEFANSVFSFIQDYGLSVGDLGRISTYGEFDGEVKIIDYGLDDDVLSNYYRKLSEEFNNINNENKEILVEIEPEEVPTKTIKFSNQLNSKLWDKDELLKPEVRIAILKISKKYINSIDKDIKFKDIVLTGSIANYNYNEQSDLDIHIVVDYKNIGDDENLLLKYFKGIKDDWSNKYKLTIYGYPVEIFIQNERTPIESAAVYSVLNNKWIQKPENDKPDFNIKEIKNIAAKFINKFDDLQKYFKVNKDYDKALSDIETIKKEISDMRKVGLDKEGEFSTENLSFKLLRNLGTLNKINTFKEKLINKQLTLKEETK
jgi:predicted nucleotidyltransferase